MALEIERKYIIRIPAVLQQLRHVGISQTYLKCDNGTRRVRRMQDEDGTRYYYTHKLRRTNVTCEEHEEQIDGLRYEQLLALRDEDLHTVEKVRYYYPFAGLTFEIDVYPFWHTQCVMEVELQSENQAIALPPDIEILREVTDDFSYKNVSLARAVPTEIDG